VVHKTEISIYFKKHKETGFTLIELLVVIAIIGILAAGVLLALGSARQRSRDARRLADIKEIATAMESYYEHCNSYPIVTAATVLDTTKSLAGGTDPICGDNQGTDPNGGIGSTTGTVFFGQFASAVTPPDGDCATALGGNNANPYTYTSFSDVERTTQSVGGDTHAAGYTLTFCLGSATGAYSASLHTLTQTGVQ
jgi:prepilin-type N-terminal cleavage/methylation domain-containing protein